MVVRKCPKSIVLPPTALSPAQTTTCLPASTVSRGLSDDSQTPSMVDPRALSLTEYEQSQTLPPLRHEHGQGSSALRRVAASSTQGEQSQLNGEKGDITVKSTPQDSSYLLDRPPISQHSVLDGRGSTRKWTFGPNGDPTQHWSEGTPVEGVEDRFDKKSLSLQQLSRENNVDPIPEACAQRHSPLDATSARQVVEDHNTNPFRSRIKGNHQSSTEIAHPLMIGTRSLGPSHLIPDPEIPSDWIDQLSLNSQPAHGRSGLQDLQTNQLVSGEPDYRDGLSNPSDLRSEVLRSTHKSSSPTYYQASAQYQDLNSSRETGSRSPILPDIHKQLPMTPTMGQPSESLGRLVQREGESQDLSSVRQKPADKANVEIDLLKLRAQRNATYQIKHFTWFDHSSRTLRRSSMLIQNENGPCPLLALVNALILGVEDDANSALGTALRTREQVSLGLIIETLMDELTSEGRGAELTELPDVDELNQFLLMLHTGMTANPRLATPTPHLDLMDARNSILHLPLSLNDDRKPGGFEETQAMRLYGAFGIPLIHGWLAPRSDPAKAAFSRSGLTYEDAQAVQFREEELQNKLSQQGLTSGEEQLLQDISAIRTFLGSHPTQITPYGLDVINESLFPGAFAILFRNDHFSTVYKHPETGQLFTLVTDAGYSDRDEVIWESLVDVSGQQNEFFSGDFRHVGNAEVHMPESQSLGNDVNLHSVRSVDQGSSPMSPQDHQRLADADFAMALQLQEEEDARLEEAPRHQSGGNVGVQNRNTGSNSRGLSGQEGSRPSIPPRSARNQGVTRPIDPNSDEAPPPAYEEAAKGRPYLPPRGHPQHPSFDARSQGSDPIPSPRVTSSRGTAPPPRRMSNLPHNSQYSGRPTLSRPPTNNGVIMQQPPRQARDREKDCIVM